MKKKTILLSLISLMTIGLVLVFSSTPNQSLFLPNFASTHDCNGNHYNEIKENESENGCNEYWVCCQCHTHYLSTLDIPNYNPANWTDAGKYQRFNDTTDTRHVGSLFNETISKDGCGFTVNGNSVTGSNFDGWIVSKNQYYNFNMDVTMSQSSACNPYSNHQITNAIIIGGQINDGVLSGFVLQFATSFIELFYLDGTNANVAGNCIQFKGGDFSNTTLNIDVNNDILTVKQGDTTLIYCYLSLYNYATATTTVTQTYNGGHIGLLSYLDPDNNTIRGTTLTVSNFVNRTSPILNDAVYNNTNWILSDDRKQISTNGQDGLILTNKTYTDVNLRVKADTVSNQNIYSSHFPSNAIIIGGKINNGVLSGYVVEIQDTFVEIAKLNGEANYKTDSVLKYIGTSYSGFSKDNDVFISVVGQNLTIKAFDRQNNTYLSETYTMSNYTGGSIGYLSQLASLDSNPNSASIIVEQVLDIDDPIYNDNEEVDVVRGGWDETNETLTSKYNENFALVKNTTLASGSFSSKMKANGIRNSGIIFNSNDEGTEYYALYMNSEYGNQLKLGKMAGGSYAELDSCFVSVGYETTAEITLTVEINNGDIKCFFNDKLLIVKVDESPLAHTRVGFIASNVGGVFSNYEVSETRNFTTVDTLLVGHSYMELWTNYKTDLSKYSDIVNLGIGGSATTDWIGHRDEIKAFAPNRLVYMIGINDVAMWSTPAETIFSNVETLIDGIMEDLPETEICILSINRCPSYDEDAHKEIISGYNELLKDYCNTNDNLNYGDLDDAFLDAEGNPDAACFIEDQLHPTEASYSVIANAIYEAFGDNA